MLMLRDAIMQRQHLFSEMNYWSNFRCNLVKGRKEILQKSLKHLLKSEVLNEKERKMTKVTVDM